MGDGRRLPGRSAGPIPSTGIHFYTFAAVRASSTYPNHFWPSSLDHSANAEMRVLSARRKAVKSAKRELRPYPLSFGGLQAPLHAPRVDHGVVTTDELIPGFQIRGELLDPFYQRQ
jgi:hypothetical protein